MFINKYLNDVYINLLYSTYKEAYLNQIEEDNFKKIYNLLKKNNFYYIDDIILKYLELFTVNEIFVAKALKDFRKLLGENYVEQIGNNMSLIDKLIELAQKYEENDITG